EVKEEKATKNTTHLIIKNKIFTPTVPSKPAGELGSFSLKKVDSKDSMKVLSGAEFKLTEKATDKEYILVTDLNGEADISKLALGAYTLEETKAPEGYILEKNIQEVNVKETDKMKPVIIKNKAEQPVIPLEPSTVLGTVAIKKVDANDMTKSLPGAEFKLTEKTTNKMYTLVTDKSGEAKKGQLPLGVYTLEEIKAPKGYVLDKRIQQLEVRKNIATNHSVQLIVKNKKEIIHETTGSKDNKLQTRGANARSFAANEPSFTAFTSSFKPGRQMTAMLPITGHKTSKMLPKTGEEETKNYLTILGIILLTILGFAYREKNTNKDPFAG
ncbi:MAG: SpaA isopeptide-forming pilin-related protein, partial [Vagococcus sp.]|uniref:MSCRAMM family protein n=1 Tax=Vagococcus sp. TaxID=1933889 RepID=UPI002FC6DD91